MFSQTLNLQIFIMKFFLVSFLKRYNFSIDIKKCIYNYLILQKRHFAATYFKRKKIMKKFVDLEFVKICPEE